MKFLILAIFAVLHSSYAIIQQKSCTSYNDPHMKNFAGSFFEFHQSGEYCMYNSGSVEITAGFSQCSPPNPTPTCNCMIRIKILTGAHAGQFLTIDTCSSTTWSVQTSTSTVVTCPALAATNAQLFVDTWWLSQPSTSVFPGFRCTQTISGATAIRTDFSAPNDALVLGYPGWPSMSAIEIYASNNYFITQYLNDKCLCGQHDLNQNTECENVLQDKCFLNTVKDPEAEALIKKLVLDCKNDANIFPNGETADGRAAIGIFQKDVFEAKKMEFLVKKYQPTAPAFTPAFTQALTRYCACRGLRLNQACIVNRKCNPFKICI